MGIRHLQTFMERSVKGGLYPIQMDHEVGRASNGNTKPLVVIDLMALFGLFCIDKNNALCGSQVARVESEADAFFGRLVATGAELVFFYDGSVQPTKYDTWIARQNNKYENMIAIIDAVDRGVPLSKISTQYERTIPNNTCLKLDRVARRYGEVIISIQEECDQALAAYATEHKALAIISHDTDFLIFQGNWQLWSVNHINPNTLKTLSYNRDALLRALRLRRDQMAVWATLAGNDFFRYDEVEPFHRTLGPHHLKFYKLAEYVRSLPHKKQLTEHTVQRILEDVYTLRLIPSEAVSRFMQSLAFFKNDNKSMNHNMDELAIFLCSAGQQLVHNILTGTPFNCTLFFFDYRSPAFGSYFDIIVRILARIAGIVLYHSKEQRKELLVVTKRSHTEPHAPCSIPAEFPPANIVPPPIMELLERNEDTSGSLLTCKLHLLAWVCSDQLPAESFAALPTSLMLTVMTCFRLVECGALALFEADLLLWIAHELSVGGFDPAAERKPYRLDPRAFRIGFLFQKVYGHCARVAKALGLPIDYRPAAPYDGLRFHNQYGVWAKGTTLHNFVRSIAEWRLYTIICCRNS